MKNISQEVIGGLETANRKIQTLYNSVPGGIFQCLYDEDLTLIEMSEGFLSMIGYTREQVRDEAGNSLRRLIVPEDLAASIAEVSEQLKMSNSKEIQYRLIHRDGHLVQVLDRGTLMDDELGRPAFYCIVVDITKEKEMAKELRLSLDRYQIIANQTNDVIFEWDIRHDTLEITGNWEKRFGKRRYGDRCSLYAILDDRDYHVFAPEDMPLVYDAIRRIKEGQPYLEAEIRLRSEDSTYIWCRARMTQQLGQDGKAAKVIGVLIDIDREKKQSQYLKKQAQQDALTGIYNKMTTNALIRDYVTDGGAPAALMVVDIDNFKQVNDTFGHLYGDAVLSNLARSMLDSFRGTDILGRIGGDEFLVFLKDIETMEGAEINAAKILKLFEKLKVNGKQSLNISCSIGISLFPADGKDFVTLYQRADYALYEAKKAGKNRYAFFDVNVMQRFLDYQKNPISSITASIDSNEEHRVLDTRIVEYVFRVLYGAEDVGDAITTILEIVGNYFNVSRVYIFENIEEDRYCSNTFEWCKAGVAPQIGKLSRISYEADLGGRYYENFDENNLFYCPDISVLPEEQQKVLAPQGILSMLQCAITDDGKFRGFVGFDECEERRYWTKDQIEMLGFIAEIISVFLLKRRAREQYMQENEGLRGILDNQSAWIYVIDPDTKELLFINRKAREMVPDAKEGTTCFKTFQNRETQCADCPVTRLSQECRNYTMEFYNAYLDVWSDADASLVTWKGREAVMLSCHDITKYKK